MNIIIFDFEKADGSYVTVTKNEQKYSVLINYKPTQTELDADDVIRYLSNMSYNLECKVSKLEKESK